MSIAPRAKNCHYNNRWRLRRKSASCTLNTYGPPGQMYTADTDRVEATKNALKQYIYYRQACELKFVKVWRKYIPEAQLTTLENKFFYQMTINRS
jgi:hypothetical protein